MVPPCYSDLGKAARDLFDKGYNFGLVSLETKTKTQNGVEFTVKGHSPLDSGKVVGNMETKYKWTDYGLTLTEKWNTDNILNTEVSVEDQIAKGLKLAFDTSFAPHTGKKSGKIKTAYKHNYIHVNADIDFDFAGPTLHGSSVLLYNGWLAGCQMSFDTANSRLVKNNFAVGYTTSDFALHSSINDGHEFAGSIYQRINQDLESGVNLSWTSGTNVTRFGLGAKYCIDADTSFSAKVNNSSQVGIAFSHILRKGIKLTLSTLIEGKGLSQGGHKVGLGLEIAA